MAVYNGEKYLKEQIESILAQTHRDFELVIMDDASSDRSQEIIYEFARVDSRIRVFRNERNLGTSANFLRGLSHAEGELISYSDQDDYWRRDKLEVLIALINRDSDTTLVYSDLEVCDERLNCISPSFWKLANILPKKGSLNEIALLKNFIPGCSMMFRRKVKGVMAKVAAEAPFMHDHLAFILSSAMGQIVYSKEKLVKYRQHGNNQIGVFGNATFNKQVFIWDLTRKAEYLKAMPLNGFSSNLVNLQRFCECLSHGGLALRLSYVRYYLFLRNDTLQDKLLGFLECLAPKVYDRLRLTN